MKVGSRVSYNIDPHFTGTVKAVTRHHEFSPLYYVKWDQSSLCELPYVRAELREVK